MAVLFICLPIHLIKRLQPLLNNELFLGRRFLLAPLGDGAGEDAVYQVGEPSLDFLLVADRKDAASNPEVALSKAYQQR